jgi:CRISPR-associated protein Cas1
LPIVRAVVVGKLANQIALLRARPQLWGTTGQRAVAIMERARQDAARAADADSARGYEGVGAAAYWQAWKALLGPSWGFAGREYHPPRDPVNALLSFGYTLLLNELQVNVQKSGLHPGLGFFHTVQAGRPSLALDLEEEFRPLIVDPLVLSLLERRVISRADFAAPAEPPGALYLSEAGRDHFIPAYEAWVQQRVYYPYTNRPQAQAETWRRCMALQVQQMARVIAGEQAEYYPLIAPPAVRPGDRVEPGAGEEEEG